jgi:hypothetical protein
MSATLLGDIHIYARHVSKPDTDETYLFLTVKGRFITPSKYLSTPASSNAKTGRQDIVESGAKTTKINQINL